MLLLVMVMRLALLTVEDSDDDASASVEDRLPITVMGHSLGGAVVSCLPASLGPAPRGDGIVSSVLVMAPALDMAFAPLSM